MTDSRSKKLILTKDAKQDLRDIRTYIIAKAGQLDAEKFVGQIGEYLLHLAEIGSPGTNRDWIHPGLRLHVFGRYNVYFRIDDDKMVVLHVLAVSRDLDEIDFE